MDRLKEIKKLYTKLNKAERTYLHLHVEAFANAGTRNYDLMQMLLQLVQFNASISAGDLEHQDFYKNLTNVERSQLMLDARELLLETLLVSANVERPGLFSNTFKTQINNAKRIQQANILHVRGARDEAIKLLEEVLSRSRKYELVNQELEALRFLQYYETAEKGLRSCNRISSLIAQAKAKAEVLDLAMETYLKLKLVPDRLRIEKPLNDWERIIEELELANQPWEMTYPRYICSLIKVYHYRISGDFNEELNEINSLTQLVEDSPRLYSRKLMVNLNLEKAEALINLALYDDARTTLAATSDLVKKSSFENYLIEKYQVLIDFYEQRYQPLEDRLDKLVKSKYFQRMPYAIAQFYFYKSASIVYKGDAGAVTHQIDEALNRFDDLSTELKKGYLFLACKSAVRADLGADAAVVKKVFGLLDAMEEENGLSKREQLFYHAVKNMLSASGNAKAMKYNAIIDRLSATNTTLAWQPFGHEVIPFHTWMRKHTESFNARRAKKTTDVS